MRILALVVLAVVLAPARPAHAQYTNSYGYTFNNPISATANQYFWDGLNRRLVMRMMLKKRGYTDVQLGQMTTAEMRAILEGSQPATGSRPTAAPATKPFANATRFKPAPRRLLVGSIVDNLVADKAQRAALVELFGNAIDAYEAEAKKTGFDHDIAGAMAFFIGAAYLVHHDGTEPDEKGLELLAGALRDQMATAEVAKISAAEKQKFYELMLVLGTFLLASHQQATAEGDRATLATLKTTAGEVLKGFLKLDPAAFQITANGLELVQP